jgi:hypothetical protein
MGALMTAIIEWTHDSQCAAEVVEASASIKARWGDDHLHGILFNTDKEYDFFAAVAGLRNRFGKQPLIDLRGVPNNLSSPASVHFKLSDRVNAGWLHHSEIKLCFRHFGLENQRHGFELEFALEMMRQLVAKLGDAHVRLVFDILD